MVILNWTSEKICFFALLWTFLICGYCGPSRTPARRSTTVPQIERTRSWLLWKKETLMKKTDLCQKCFEDVTKSEKEAPKTDLRIIMAGENHFTKGELTKMMHYTDSQLDCFRVSAGLSTKGFNPYCCGIPLWFFFSNLKKRNLTEDEVLILFYQIYQDAFAHLRETKKYPRSLIFDLRNRGVGVWSKNAKTGEINDEGADAPYFVNFLLGLVTGFQHANRPMMLRNGKELPTRTVMPMEDGTIVVKGYTPTSEQPSKLLLSSRYQEARLRADMVNGLYQKGLTQKSDQDEPSTSGIEVPTEKLTPPASSATAETESSKIKPQNIQGGARPGKLPTSTQPDETLNADLDGEEELESFFRAWNIPSSSVPMDADQATCSKYLTP